MVAGHLDILSDDVDVLGVVAECAKLIICALAELMTKILCAKARAMIFSDVLAPGAF